MAGAVDRQHRQPVGDLVQQLPGGMGPAGEEAVIVAPAQDHVAALTAAEGGQGVPDGLEAAAAAQVRRGTQLQGHGEVAVAVHKPRQHRSAVQLHPPGPGAQGRQRSRVAHGPDFPVLHQQPRGPGQPAGQGQNGPAHIKRCGSVFHGIPPARRQSA